MSANDRQVAGNHYRNYDSTIQHWDFAAAQNLDYFQGQITKYVCRWKDKNGIEDLQKARHFLDKYIEIIDDVSDVPPIGGDATSAYVNQG